MLRALFLVVVLCQATGALAGSLPKTLLSLNVFDQLQGNWAPDFRQNRMRILSDWIREHNPDLVVFQEAQGDDEDSADAVALRDLYPYRRYVHEMTGVDGKSYGYWMGAKRKPVKEWSDGFAFAGGVARKTQAALWRKGFSCLGVLQLHLSYQNSAVRVQEAEWVVAWLKKQRSQCSHWLVVGDFNADASTPELQYLFNHGLNDLVVERKPTVGAFNPIRQIYGRDIPSLTIDWVLGTNNLKHKAKAQVVLDHDLNGVWLSDHAANWLEFR